MDPQDSAAAQQQQGTQLGDTDSTDAGSDPSNAPINLPVAPTPAAIAHLLGLPPGAPGRPPVAPANGNNNNRGGLAAGLVNLFAGITGRRRPRRSSGSGSIGSVADSAMSMQDAMNANVFPNQVQQVQYQRAPPVRPRGFAVQQAYYMRGAGRHGAQEARRLELQELLRKKMLELPVAQRHVLLERAIQMPGMKLAFSRSLADTASAATAPAPAEGGAAAEPEQDLERALAAIVAELSNAPIPTPAAATPAPVAAPAPATQTTDASTSTPAPAPAPAPAVAPTATAAAAAPAITVRLIPEYEISPTAADTAMRAVVSLKAASDTPVRARVGLSCVLDRSGSMEGQRISLLQETVHFLITQLQAEDLLGLVSYSDGVREDLPLVSMCPAAKDLAHAVVEALEADGSTALYDGTIGGLAQQIVGCVELPPGAEPSADAAVLAARRPGAGLMQRMAAAMARNQLDGAAAAAAAAAVRRDNGDGEDARLVRAVLLCTDGEANVGPQNSDTILPGLRRAQAAWGVLEPLTLHTFGIGNGHDARLLQAIAQAQSGVYYNLASSDDIPEAYGDALGGLLSVVAKSVRVRILPRAGVTVTALNSGGRLAAAPPAPATHEVSFNDLFAEESRELLLALRLPAGEAAAAAETAAVDVELEYTDAATGAVVKSTHTLKVRRGAAAVAAPRAPAVPAATGAAATAAVADVPAGHPLVLVTAARYMTAEALTAAMRSAEGGRCEDARATLNRQVASLRALSKQITPQQSPAAAGAESAGPSGAAGPSAAVPADGSELLEKSHIESVAMLLDQAEQALEELADRRVAAQTSVQADWAATTSALVNQRGTMKSKAPSSPSPMGMAGGPYAAMSPGGGTKYSGYDSKFKSAMRSTAVTSVNAQMMSKQQSPAPNNMS